MFKKLYELMIFAVAISFAVPAGFATEIPSESSKAKYFYVFGSDSDPYVGAEDSELSIYVDVPAAEQGDVTIEVTDPDTSGNKDYRIRYDNPWNTSTNFSVHGSDKLAEQTFGAGDDTYDGKRFKFGPFSKTQGQKVGDKYRFRVDVKGLSGDDGNLFYFRVKPNSADVFSENITWRLRSGHGNKMYFYPEIPAGTTNITVENYDLDQDGGVSVLHDKYARQKYAINDSSSAQWSKTDIQLMDGPARRLEYVVTKKTQRSAHAGLKVSSNGKPLPIYFKKSAAPVPVRKEKVVRKEPAPANSCNEFVFDARSSYDEDKDKITYEWDFGDGSKSTDAVVKHVYQKGGQYNVRLTVSDHSGLRCETETTTQVVDVNTPPTAAFSAEELVCTGETVTLNAGASSDDQSSKLAYNWAFGDGTYGEGKTVTKTYSKGGVYNVGLTVDDGAGSSCSVDSTSRTVRVNSAPTADAGNDIALCLDNPGEEYSIGFDGSGSRDNDGDDLTYSWDFGDGSRAEGRRVQHTYTKSGDYVARLSVSDNSGAACSADSDTVKVSLNRAPIAEAGKDRYACTGTKVRFDGSDSYGDDGQSLSYHWDFGDGTTAKGKNVEHAYGEGGNYTAVLTVDNGSGASCASDVDTTRVHINSGPRAILAKAENSCAGDKVNFDASDSSDPDGNSLRYTWDFGDGTVVEGGSKTSHTYQKGGTYKVNVTVDDGSGSPCATSSASTYVEVNTRPVADAGPNLVCCEDQTNSFDASASSDADGDSLTYNWDFGDGGKDTGAQVSHSYRERGTYKVTVTVDDGSGTYCSSSSSSFMANVNAKPVPIIKVKQG